MISIPPIDAIISEMSEAIAVLLDPTEGGVDFQGTHLLDSGQHLQLIQQQEARLNHRHALYDEVISAAQAIKDKIQAVLDDGYPAIPLAEVNDDALADLDDQLRTMAAFRKTFVPRRPAVKANVSFSAPRKK